MPGLRGGNVHGHEGQLELRGLSGWHFQRSFSRELLGVPGRHLQLHERFVVHELLRGHLRGHTGHSHVHLMQLRTLAASGGPDVMRQVRGRPEPERHGAERVRGLQDRDLHRQECDLELFRVRSWENLGDIRRH